MTSSFILTNEKIDRLAAVLRAAIELVGPEGEMDVALENGDRLRPGLNMQVDAAVLEKRLTDINQGLFTLLVLGEFNNGKSTLLNAMLGGKVLPAGGIPTTAIITVLVQGQREDVAIYKTNHQRPEYLSWDAFVSAYRLSRENARRVSRGETLNQYKQIEYAQIETTHPICMHRVRLVDSPGLGEHISRTRLTTNFLKQAQAVIVVLSAIQPLTENERLFIAHELGQNRLEHVFFVVNRINQIDEDDVLDIKDYFALGLEPHFTDENGQFDEAFYKRRVFFVDALAALKARAADPPDLDKLTASQIPALEAALQSFLQSSDKVTAVYESTLQLLRRIEQKIGLRIKERKAALNQPIEQLEANKAIALQMLEGLQTKQTTLIQEIITTGERIYSHLQTNLAEYIGKLEEQWPAEVTQIVSAFDIFSEDILEAHRDDQKQQRLEKKINAIVTEYIASKLKHWSDEVYQEIAFQVSDLEEKVKKDIFDFSQEIDRIRHLFVFGPERAKDFTGLGDEGHARHFATIVVLKGDWTIQINNLMGTFSEFLAFFGADAIATYIQLDHITNQVLSFLGPTGQALQEKKDKAYIDQFCKELGKQIHQALQNDLVRQVFFEHNIKDFTALAQKLIDQQDPLSKYIWANFSPETQQDLTAWLEAKRGKPSQGERQGDQPGEADQQAKGAQGWSPLSRLVQDLNHLIERDECLYEEERFAGIHLRDETKLQLDQPKFVGRKPIILNRWLLVEAYAEVFAEKLQDTLYHNLMYQFNQFAHETTRPLAERVNELLAEMDDVLHKLKVEQSKVAAEIERLDKIAQRYKMHLAELNMNTPSKQANLNGEIQS